MKFVLIDRIVEFEPGQRIVARKALSLAEEYLADHFPKFPVLPGVLMLEAMVQASAWLVRTRLDFAPSIIVLKEARNVTYKSFLAPGQIMTIESVCKEFGPTESTYAASGAVDGREMLKGRLTLRHLALAETQPDARETDEKLRAHQRALFKLLWQGSPAGVAAGVPLDN